MPELKKIIASGQRLLFDGGLGTMLQARGLPAGASPEAFCLEHPDILEGIHADYALAGADILTTNTFGGTSFKLPAEFEPLDFNRRMTLITRKAADKAAKDTGRRIYVAGSVGPTGHFLAPLGDTSFDQMVSAFARQIQGLLEGGADLILGETQFDIAEARAIVLACRRVNSTVPVAISMTYESGATLTGSSVEVCSATLANLGVDLVGMNCSAGPAEMRDAALALLQSSPVPVLIQPNAGLPLLVDGGTIFPLGPEEFANRTFEFARSGAQAVGGCCGTTPQHISCLRKRIACLEAPAPRPVHAGIALTSRSRLVRLGQGYPVRIIGERINPTGKKALAAELQRGEFTTALRFAEEQTACGAPILDVNVGAPMVDETVVLPELVSSLISASQLPLSLDSSNNEAMARAIALYPASPLVNSISGEEGRMEFLGPLCLDFGAPFILLPLQGRDLPVTARDRIAILERLLEKMDGLRIPRSLALVDILALSASSSEAAGRECLEFIRYCTQKLNLPTVCGLSNISFGLPARELLNSTFLGLALGAGLSACIANPGSMRIMETVDSANLLLGHDPGAERFIGRYAGWKAGTPGSAASGGTASGQGERGPAPSGQEAGDVTGRLKQAVILGRREGVETLVSDALAEGFEPYALVGEWLIPAITEVGLKYEKKEYFLPQLIRSAETMQAAFTVLRPLLENSQDAGKRPVIIMATVEGDIHDIGKNIVSLMLGNHGFEVIDLGKDVTAEDIVEASIRHEASIIGLSALMTTTMIRMKDTVELLRSRGLDKKVIVGGAVVTDDFARTIGAHYAKDAVDAVRVAQELDVIQ